MSRWQQAFDNQFGAQLIAARDALAQTSMDAAAPAVMVEELARLSKAFAYLDGLVETLDIELVPLRKWDEAAPQLSACANELITFASDRTQEHLQAANNYLDSAIEIVRPFVPFVSKGTRAYARAVSEQARTASEHLEGAARVIAERLAAIEESAKGASDSAKTAREIEQSLQSSATELLGSEGKPGIADKAKAVLADIEDSQETINDYYNEIFSGDGEAPSKKVAIDAALAQAKQSAADAANTATSAKKSTSALEEFFERTFGLVGEDDKRVGGIDAELEALKGRLNEFQGKQEQRYKALNDQIESLLPGATSAGLASAYRDMKESFDKPIRFFSNVFFVSIAVLVVGSLVLAIDSFSWVNGIRFAQVSGWEKVLESFAYKLPFYGPAVWLAYYASKRRSENQRLQQEYAHKEALAKSYDSYKKQISELDADDDSMLTMLLTKAIDAISHNASQSLDGKHGDKMPLHEAIEKLARIMADKQLPKDS